MAIPIEYKIIECKIMHVKTFVKVITHPEHINSCGTILWELLVLNCLPFVLLGLVLLILKKKVIFVFKKEFVIECAMNIHKSSYSWVFSNICNMIPHLFLFLIFLPTSLLNHQFFHFPLQLFKSCNKPVFRYF